MGTTYRRLSHTDLSCIVSCVCISEQVVWCWWITETDFRCIKERSDQVACETIRTFLRFSGFFSKSKKTWLFTFFWVLTHVFSNTSVTHDSNSAEQFLGRLSAKNFILFIICYLTSTTFRLLTGRLHVHQRYRFRLRPLDLDILTVWLILKPVIVVSVTVVLNTLFAKVWLSAAS